MKTEGAETAINRSILKTVPLQLTGYSLKCGAAVHRCYQREGMGLLEYQPMPPLRDVAHGCVQYNQPSLAFGLIGSDPCLFDKNWFWPSRDQSSIRRLEC